MSDKLIPTDLKEYIDTRVSCLVLYGFIIGIVVNYTGLTSFILGITTGIIVRNDEVTLYIKRSLIDVFNRVVNIII